MPCSDPLPSNAEVAWMNLQDRHCRKAAELLCNGDYEELLTVLGPSFEAWMVEHKAIDRERARLKKAGSYWA
jgi:hypothetical protein